MFALTAISDRIQDNPHGKARKIFLRTNDVVLIFLAAFSMRVRKLAVSFRLRCGILKAKDAPLE